MNENKGKKYGRNRREENKYGRKQEEARKKMEKRQEKIKKERKENSRKEVEGWKEDLGRWIDKKEGKEGRIRRTGDRKQSK